MMLGMQDIPGTLQMVSPPSVRILQQLLSSALAPAVVLSHPARLVLATLTRPYGS